MSVLVKGMEMPKHCRECCLEAEGYFCWAFEATRKDTDAWNNTQYYGDTETLPEWCPLVPVPPHGDLIDRDALMLRVNMHGTNKFGMLDEDIRQFVNAAPTIIQAEEES